MCIDRYDGADVDEDDDYYIYGCDSNDCSDDGGDADSLYVVVDLHLTADSCQPRPPSGGGGPLLGLPLTG